MKKIFIPSDEKIHYDSVSIAKGHHQVTYRGIKAIRSPFDYLIYQMILFKLKPDLIIEIGTNEGGGALYLADLLEISGKGIIHSIDIHDKCQAIVKNHPRINLFFSGWEGYNLNNVKGYETILVIEDGSHYYSDTLAAMEKFADVVTPGSYLIVEDGVINELGTEKDYQGGPLKAIREFLPKRKEFTVDRFWCDFFGKNATFNVNGYLKKQNK